MIFQTVMRQRGRVGPKLTYRRGENV
jgi:hypothetical protein